MQSLATNIQRRTFIGGLGLTGAGLCLGFPIFAAETLGPAMERVQAVGKGLAPNVFFHVAPTGIVSIVCHRSEMGQGIRSSLPVLMAEELGIAMKNVRIIQGDGDKAYGDQNTDGSRSIRGIHMAMRTAAATVRMMLVNAAAKEWNVAADSCSVANGEIKHAATGRALGFGQVAEAAALLPVPDVTKVVVRDFSEYKEVGTDLPLLDGPAYVQGKAVFGADIKLPGMLIALIARPPVVGGKPKTYDAKKALKVRGVKKVVALPTPTQPYIFQPWGGVAVLAENTWAAMKGRDELGITWDHGPNVSYDSVQFQKTLLEAVRKPGKPMRVLGDTEKALKEAKAIVDAEYYVPHLPHVPMEPPVALAHYHKEGGGSCEVWAPTQNPQAAIKEVARVLGLPEDKVTVHVTFLGGGFGRKSKADFASEAAFLSREVGAPVRVQFTREDDIRHDYVNTVSAQKLTAGLDDKGKVIAWRHRTAFPPISSLFDPKSMAASAGDLQQGVLDLALSVPNVQAESCEAKSHVRTGWLRAVYNLFHAFAVNSFLDEIAHARKEDPKSVMLEVYGPARDLSLKDLGIEALSNYGGSLEEYPVDAGRLRGVIEQVTKNAGWDQRKDKKGRAYGLAAHRSFLSYVGVVAAVSSVDGKMPKVEEVWLVIDAGIVVNLDRVKTQMQGAVLNGINHAFYGGVTYKEGAVEQSNFDGVQLVRMGEEPIVHVEILASKESPGGCGEPGVPPVAPAIANAIFALTGKRHRAMPFV